MSHHGESLHGPRPINVGSAERAASVALGAGLTLLGLSRRSIPGLLVAGFGGALLHRGVTGNCHGYQAMGVRPEDATATSHPLNRVIHGTRSITINRPAGEIYRFWRDFKNLEQLIPRLRRVEDLGGDRYRWTIDGPGGQELSFTSRLTEDRADECLAWHSEEGTTLYNAGRIEFEPAPGGRGTRVTLQFRYRTPYGVLGAALAKVQMASPYGEMVEALRRMKQLLETGEIADGGGTSGRDTVKPRRFRGLGFGGKRQGAPRDAGRDVGFEGPLPEGRPAANVNVNLPPGSAPGAREPGMA